MSGLQYNLNCTNFTIKQLDSINLSREITAGTCIILLFLILFILCYSKAYTSTIERLFLYLIVADIVREILLTASLEHLFYYPEQDEVCTALGFLTHWSSTIAVLCALGVILYAVLKVCVTVKYTHSQRSVLTSRCKVLLERSYLMFVIFFPLVYLWVPLMTGNYGLAVAWCWIRAINGDCENVGLIEQIVVGYLPYELVGIIVLTAAIAMIYTYRKMSADLQYAKKLIKQSLILTFFLLSYVFVISTALAIRIYSGITGWTQHYAMWIINGVIVPLAQLIVLFGFLGSFYYKHFQRKCCGTHIRRSKYNKLDSKEHKTFPASNRLSASINTFFVVPYTDQFTVIQGADIDNV